MGLVATPLMVAAAYHDGVAIQFFDVAADHDRVSAKLLCHEIISNFERSIS